MKDIYTREEIEDISSEHIWLNALGGTIESKNLIDKQTNDYFGRTIDSELVKFFDFFRTILNNSNGDGKSPPIFRGALEQDGNRRMNILPGGKPQFANPNVKFEKQDNSTNIHVSARDEDELKKILTGLSNKHKLNLDIDNLITSAKRVEDAPTVQFQTVFGEGHRRCIAKMACNMFACEYREEFMSDSFDKIRNYVYNGLDDDQKGQWFVKSLIKPIDFTSEFPGFSHVDHVLGFYQKDQEVFGFATIYGYFQFVVKIGTSDSEIQSKIMRIDPFHKEVQIDTGDELVTHVCSCRLGESYDDMLSSTALSLEMALGFLAGKTINEQKSILVQNVISEAKDKFERNLISEEEILSYIASEVGERFIELLFNNGMIDTLRIP